MEESEGNKLETVEEGTEPITEADNTDEFPKTETPAQTTAEEETDYSGKSQDFTDNRDAAEAEVTDPVPEPSEEEESLVNNILEATDEAPEECTDPSIEDTEVKSTEEASADEAAVKEVEKPHLPASDMFEEGEEKEPPQLIGELLSREGSPVDEQGRSPPELEPETPQRENHVEEAETVMVEAKEEGPSVNYEEYMERYRELQKEKQKIFQKNGQLQKKLEQYLRRKTGEEVRHEREKPVSDQEQRYIKYMVTTGDLKLQHKQDSESYQQQIEDLRAQSQEKVAQVDSEWKAFVGIKKDVAVLVLSRQLGKQAALSQVEQNQANEQRKEKELVQVRVENIKLMNKTRKLEAMLKAKEELAEGLHLIDFEQLKIENQTYNEKIEERNEELMKLRKKITSTVQVLTHVKEKLQFVQVENQAKKAQLTETQALVANKRDILTRTKRARDNLRIDNLKMRQQCGLRGNETLLRDFEEKVDVSEVLRQRLEMAKRCHADLTLRCAGVKKKLEQAKPSHQSMQ